MSVSDVSNCISNILNMGMFGTIVNVTLIILGSAIGSFLKKKFDEEYRKALFVAMGVCSFVVGILASVQPVYHVSENPANPVLLIVSVGLGCVIGTYFKLHDRFIKFSKRFGKDNSFGNGLVTAILLFCVGTLSILGPMKSALYGDNSLLLTNASLDFITSIALASAYGFGIALASVVLFLFQGSIYVITLFMQDLLPSYMLNNAMLVGGALIMLSSINLLELKQIKTTDYLPALFLAPFFAYIYHIFIQ